MEYNIDVKMNVYETYRIEAKNVEEAKEKFENGDVLYPHSELVDDVEIISITEVKE